MVWSTRWIRSAAALLAFATLPTLSCGDDTSGVGGTGGGGGSGVLVCKLLESDVPGCVCDFSMQDEPVDNCSETAGDGYFCCAVEGFPDGGSCRCQPGCSRKDDGTSCTCNPGVASIEGDSTFVASCDEDPWVECCNFADGTGCVCGNEADTCAASDVIPASACSPAVLPCASGSVRADSCGP